MRKQRLLGAIVLSLSGLLATGCSGKAPDGVDDGGAMQPADSAMSAGGGQSSGGSTIPTGKPASGPFTLAWKALIRDGSIAKTVPQLADLDGDGRLDIVMNPRISNLIVYAGQGDGTFAAARPLGTDIMNGWGLDTADFDGDGRIDIAVGDHNVMITDKAFRNQGSFKFSDSSAGLPMVPMATGLSGCGLGDFNGDHLFDYVAGSDQFQLKMGHLYMAFGDGKGGWTAMQPSGLDLRVSNAGNFFVADLNRDGQMDFVTASSQVTTSSNVYANVYINQGKGLSWSAREYGPFPINAYQQQLSVADVNHDQVLDLAVGGVILFGDGKGGFTQQAMTLPAAYNHFADMNGDGHMDLVIHDTKIGLQLFLGDGSGTHWTQANVGLPTYDLGDGESIGIDIGDVNGNGALDIIMTYQTASPNQHNNIEAWVR